MSVTAVPLQPIKRSYIAWLWMGLAIAVAAAFLLAMQGDDFWSSSQRGWGIQTTPSGLRYKVVKPGTGAHPTDGDVGLINYEGRLRNGATFDKSQQPTPMPVKGVVPGFSEAIKLMNKGERIRVWIPAKLAYGDKDQRDKSGAVVIAANSPLVFDIELIDFLPQAVIDQYQRQMMNGAGGPGGPGGVPGGAGGMPGGPGNMPDMSGAPGGGAPGEDLLPPTGK